MSMIKLITIVSLCVAAASISGCASTTAGGAVGAKRSQLMLISSAELDQMAEQTYTKLKTDATVKGELNRDSAILKRVRAIAMHIKPQTAVFRSDAPGWNWEVNVISSKELNAFCMPGGKIMFYSGLIEQLHLSDDEIAIVMGHEIAHALREHSREQVSQALAAQTAISLGTALLGLGQTSAEVSNTVYQSFSATGILRRAGRNLNGRLAPGRFHQLRFHRYG